MMPTTVNALYPHHHTALKTKSHVGPYPALQRAVGEDGSIAFQHDLLSSSRLPAEYDSCDILYTESAWPMGLPEFNRRAGVQPFPMSDLLRRYKEVARFERGDRPFLLIAGRWAISRLPVPSFLTGISLHGNASLLFSYGLMPSSEWKTDRDVLSSLAGKYHVIGDFCCGYGLSGYIFNREGKHFVMSDYNHQCIGYIASEIMRNPVVEGKENTDPGSEK